jgi:hypothetical protein
MRKLTYTALALGAALTLSLGLGAPQASAETDSTAKTPTVSIAGVHGDDLVIEADSAKEVLVGTASVKTKKGVKSLNVASWDVYEPVPATKKADDPSDASDEGDDTVTKKYVTVDLSKITKDTYIRIKADSESDDYALTVKVPANSIKLKGKYDKKTGKITLSNGSTALTTETVLYRTENGAYSDEETTTLTAGIVDNDAVSLSKYQMSGGALYFSVKGTDYDATEDDALKTEDTEVVTGVKATVLPTRRSKEVKVTVSKLANAPKVTADYKKNTISIPKGAAYRVVRDGEALDDLLPAAGVTAKTVISVDSTKEDKDGEVINASEGFAIDVQTPGVTGSKLATKIGHYTFAAQDVTTVGDTTVVKTDEKSNAKGGIDFKVSNKSSADSYTVYYTPLGKSTEKSATIKAGKDKTFTKVSTAAGVTVTVQKVGDKATTTWSGTKVTLDGSAAPETKEAGKITVPSDMTDDVLKVKINDVDKTIADLSSASYDDKIELVTKVAAMKLAITGVTYDETEDSSSTTYSKYYNYKFTLIDKDVNIAVAQ